MRFLLTLSFFFFVQAVSGQTAIKGIVKDTKGESVPGVNIYIKGTYDGTTSEFDGSYLLETTEAGKQVIVFQYMGFKTQEEEVELNGGEIQLSPTLRETINEMSAVTITAGAMEASDEKRAVVLRPLDIVTVPSAMGDIIGAFQTLPGTSNVGNDGRLFVRGGDASETAIFIDGLMVGNAFGTTASNVPTRTRFNPNLFKGSFFSTGGYSAEFGNAMSSALALNSVDIPARTQGDLSLMSVGLGYSQTLVGKNNSLTATANYFDLNPYQHIVKQNFDWERGPFGVDGQVSLRQKIGKNGMAKGFFHTESGGMKIWQKVPGQEGRGQLVDLRNHYSFGQGSFKQTLANDWSMYGGVAFSYNVDEYNVAPFEIRNTNQIVHGKVAAVKGFSDRFSLKTGTEVFQFSYRESLKSEGLEREYSDAQVNVFSEADYYFSNSLIMRAGLRAAHSSLTGQSWVDPRFSLAYKFKHEGQVSIAAGKFSQPVVETLRVVAPESSNTRASHLLLNYFLDKNGRTIRAEAFYKDYVNLLTYQGERFLYRDIQQNGEGFAKGFDLFYRDRKSFKNTDFWVTYSFVDSKRIFANFTQMVQPGFAPRHNASVVVKHFVPKLKSQLGASFAFNDGYAYTNPNLPGEMNAKTPSFQDLSISWSYLPKPNLIIHLACSNLIGRDNIFGYQFSPIPNENGVYESLPIRQTAPRFIFLGLFLTLSKDKTANNLNNL